MDLSIIIPIYNLENYIENTLKSVFNQTEKEFEIIIVDDGSTDNSLKIVGNFIAKNKFSQCKIIQKKNGGVCSARNQGLLASSGKYVMFLDGDDYLDIELVEKVYEIINIENYDVISWGYDIVNEDKDTILHYFNKYQSKINNVMTGLESLENILINKRMWVWTGSAVYRRNFLISNNIKYTVGSINGEDQEFTYKTLSRAKGVYFISEILSFYVQRIGSISNSFNIKRFDSVYAIKRTFEYFDSSKNTKLKLISNQLKYEYVLNHYFGNINSYLSYFSDEGIIKKKRIKLLLKELDDIYPGLNNEMLSIMEKYKEKNIKLSLKIKVFTTSPLLFNWMLDIVNYIKKIKK